ncbi:hypothetical protein V757_03255 [Pelistega indica]|uniref:Helix-turn-helix domain-containing protein n=1 Tax=Pelistega indica TaxID=1414851 RepID=V8G877_9BURK|nr:helix-turn-helix domain-containing protein [Pelistega indica]ETD72605.1 hypothetical protein V757_03255 [Pelistega indica]
MNTTTQGATNSTLPIYYSYQDLERIFGVTRSTILHWVRKGELEPPLRFGHRNVRWTQQALDNFIASRERVQYA